MLKLMNEKCYSLSHVVFSSVYWHCGEAENTHTHKQKYVVAYIRDILIATI